MGTTENNVLMKFKDISGNVAITYPITKKDNVMGLGDAIRNQSVTTTGTSTIYEATVSGITELTSGISFVMIPHLASAASSPKLNVNGLGEKFIRRRVSGSTTMTYSTKTSDDWLTAGKPVTVTYDGEYWIADLPVPNANDIMGAVPIANGGTGATTVAAARNALGLGNTSGAVPIANGGTGATTATQARINLGIETTDGTVISGNANYAEVGEWVDGNPDAEDRIGYFVCVDNTTAKMTMRKATEIDDVRGVTITAPAFSGNCSNDKFDSDGNLIAKYSFVAVMGNASVIDNGTCTVNGRCMPTNDGTAMPSPNSMGYQVISRIDATHVLILVEPQADMLVRIKNDVTQKADLPKTVSGTVISLDDASGAALQGLRIYGKTTQDGTPAPDAPVELESVGDGGNLHTIVCRKNLFSDGKVYNAGLEASYGQLSTGNPVTSPAHRSSWGGVGIRVAVSPNTTYTVSSDITPCKYFTVTFYKEFDSVSSKANAISFKEFANRNTAAFTTPENCYCVVITSVSNAESDFTWSWWQVEHGSAATVYEPYEGQTLSISTPNGLPGIPVTSGGNYTDSTGQQWICDEVDFARGVRIMRFKRKRVSPELNWQYDSVTNRFYVIDDDYKRGDYYFNIPSVICTHFRAGKGTDDRIIAYINDSSRGYAFRYSELNGDISAWKEFLTNNEAYIIGELDRVIETPLSAEELAAYAAMHTNKPNTTVYNDAGAWMDVGYYTPNATMIQADIAKALDIAKTEANTYTDSKRFTATATITTTWSGSAAPYTQAVSVSGILATDIPHIMPVYSATNATAIEQKEAWACVSKAETSDGTITFICFEDKPTTAIPIQIEVMR